MQREYLTDEERQWMLSQAIDETVWGKTEPDRQIALRILKKLEGVDKRVVVENHT